MSVSFQFQQGDINNPVLKQEVLEVVASTSRLSRSDDDTSGAFWRAASAGRLNGGLGGLFHRGPPTSANASLSSTNVVFFVGKTIQFDRGNMDKAYPAFEFMLGGKTYAVRTGADKDRQLDSNRRALAITASARSSVTGAMDYLLSQTHRHRATGAADIDPAPAPAPVAMIQLPRALAAAPAAFNRARANSDFENYSQNDSASSEDLYNNQAEKPYQNA